MNMQQTQKRQSHVFPFSAIVGQDEMKLALMISAVDPTVGGVVVFGDRGTGKSTAVRSLADLLPPIQVIAGCAYNCAPEKPGGFCEQCQPYMTRPDVKDETLQAQSIPIPVVDLPLGATEDRIVGALDLERALAKGEKAFEPGLLARAHRGFLYIDEVNLLEDHLVDLLLDVAATGENIVEREGLSIRHGAKFVLVGSGNPEEGELRPQLLDRFGLSVEVTTPTDIDARVEVVRRRDAFERNPAQFCQDWEDQQQNIRMQIQSAREMIETITVPDKILYRAAEICMALGSDGLRGELTLIRSARALAALENASEVHEAHLRQVALPALRHRLRRNPLDDTGSTARIERVLEDLFDDDD